MTRDDAERMCAKLQAGAPTGVRYLVQGDNPQSCYVRRETPVMAAEPDIAPDVIAAPAQPLQLTLGC